MKNYFMLDGNKIPMSEETAASLRDKQWKPFDESVDNKNIRVSSQMGKKGLSDESPYPIRISVSHTSFGRRKGFSGSDDICPGEILTVKEAQVLINCLQRAIKHHEK